MTMRRDNRTRETSHRRYSDLFLFFWALCILLSALAIGHALALKHADRETRAFNKSLVERYAITDLCLFTEARYSRHPSQADFHTPFQNHPASLEHFPAGSMAGIPRHLRTGYGTHN